MLASIVRAMLKQRLLVVVVALGLCAAGVFRRKEADCRCVSRRDQHTGTGRDRGDGPQPGGDRATGYGPGGNRHDRFAGACGDALPEQERLVAHHPGFYRPDRRLLRPSARDGTADRSVPQLMPQASRRCSGPYPRAWARYINTPSIIPTMAKRALTVEELTERRTMQDWVVRPMLRSIQGVAEINSIGGYVKQYHVLVNPNRLRHYDLTLARLTGPSPAIMPTPAAISCPCMPSST